FSSRRRHTRWPRDWSSDVCSSDLELRGGHEEPRGRAVARDVGRTLHGELRGETLFFGRGLRAGLRVALHLLAAHEDLFGRLALLDRKSTRLNSSHVAISYAVFCLK